MKQFCRFTGVLFAVCLGAALPAAEQSALPPALQNIMRQEKYQHGNWGIYVKDLATGKVLYDYNSEQLFIPGSTAKIFTVQSLLHAYGDDYRFKTPVYPSGSIEDGVLRGDLILVAQADPTFGGRQDPGSDKIAYTPMDHSYANMVPGATLTPQNPLNGLSGLAQAIKNKGIRQIEGDVVIDDSLFVSTEKRGTVISPIIINDNLVDFVFNPKEKGATAQVYWRPMVEGYTIDNQVKTVGKGEKLGIEITAEDGGKRFVLKGTLPEGQKDILRTYAIQDPKQFARDAFIQELRRAGIALKLSEGVQKRPEVLVSQGQALQERAPENWKGKEPLAVWTSPPITEFAKLILKVSLNSGANLVPLLLAVHEGLHTFDEGMLALGKFITDVVKVAPETFVFIDGAGGDQNRLTPQAEVALLEYVYKLPPQQFQYFDQALPILGVDGSLANVAKGSVAVGKVRAKPGSGVSYNLATEKYFLDAQAFAGYISAKNGQLLAFMIAVNNGAMPTIEDIFPIFDDFGQMTVIIYDQS